MTSFSSAESSPDTPPADRASSTVRENSSSFEAAEASSEETAAESEAAVSASGEDTQADSAASETEENEELKGKIAEDGSIELEFPLDDENTMKLVFKK